jgi:hypothetical protein
LEEKKKEKKADEKADEKADDVGTEKKSELSKVESEKKKKGCIISVNKSANTFLTMSVIGMSHSSRSISNNAVDTFPAIYLGVCKKKKKRKKLKN